MSSYDNWKLAYPPEWDAKCSECGYSDCECVDDSDDEICERCGDPLCDCAEAFDLQYLPV